MGTIGPSYRGTVFTGKNSSELWTGNVTEFYISITTQAPPKPDYLALRRGTVYVAHETGLGFRMDNFAIPQSGHAVGNVVKGINVLVDAMKYPAKKIVIKDVGIVLK